VENRIGFNPKPIGLHIKPWFLHFGLRAVERAQIKSPSIMLGRSEGYME
jgi:hypothetical protein